MFFLFLMNGTAKLLEAASFAAKKHRKQQRKGALCEPYINHPLEVAFLLTEIGKVEDIDILIAAILHDTIEDTKTSEAEINKIFGKKVAEFVLEVTDDKTLSKDERKQMQIDHAPTLSTGAKHIKLADKISNIEDIIENPPEHWSLERRIEYIEWGENVIEGVRGTNSKLEDFFDELVLRAKKRLES